jgi:hypothetical protein
VNGSWIKFFTRIDLCPEFKTSGNLCAKWWMNFLTENMILTKLWSQRNKNGINWTYGKQITLKTVIKGWAEKPRPDLFGKGTELVW